MSAMDELKDALSKTADMKARADDVKALADQTKAVTEVDDHPAIRAAVDVLLQAHANYQANLVAMKDKVESVIGTPSTTA